MAKKVLIIEDDQFFSLVLKNRLEKDGHTVFQAFNGEEGMDLARKEIPDLIVLDLIMPKISGFEFLEQLKSDPIAGRIPIVIWSNLGQDSDIEKAKSLGVSEYYLKIQTSVDQFIERIQQHLQ